MRDDATTQTVGIAIYEARPKLVLREHIYIEKPYTVYRYEYETLYIRINSSQKHRHYLYIGNNTRVEVWEGCERVNILSVV